MKTTKQIQKAPKYTEKVDYITLYMENTVVPAQTHAN